MLHKHIHNATAYGLIVMLLAALLTVSMIGCRSTSAPRAQPDRLHRFDAGMYLGGFIPLKYRGWIEGEVDPDLTPEGTFVGERLRMRVLEANAHEVRIAFHVGEDASRVWFITRQPDGRLHLRHDHRDPDGTPHDLTDYGGAGFVGEDYTTCSFAADQKTIEMLPQAATNVWTMKLDWANDRFIYNLTRHDRPRFRAVFDLTSGTDGLVCCTLEKMMVDLEPYDQSKTRSITHQKIR